MRHSHPAIIDGALRTVSTCEMIRAAAAGSRVAATDPASRTAIYQANRRLGYPCEIALREGSVLVRAKPRGPAVYPLWALADGRRAIGPETMGSVADLRGVR